MADIEPSRSREAYRELIELLGDAGETFVGPDYLVTSADDQGGGLRLVMHILQSALYAHFEFDPERPVFRRIVSPTRKFTGDNPDAVYYEAPIRGDREYVVRGNLAGSCYTSFTVEAGADEGRYATRTAGVLNDGEIDVADDGSYEIVLGGAPRHHNWLDLPADAGRITTRHYFEFPEPAAADPLLHIPLTISPTIAPEAPEPWNDELVAAGLHRVINHVRGKTVDQPRPGTNPMPSWVAAEPNTFPTPEPPGDMAFSAWDAAYSMGRYQLGPDEALVMTGRWPECRFGNVALWNRFGQTYDYNNRPVGRNRSNTTLEPDGSFRIIIAHADPGVGNWLDTMGRPGGSVFWRFFLPTGPIDTPTADVVAFSDLR